MNHIDKKQSLAVTAVIFTRNEENNIAQCIASLESFNSIMIVDSESTDQTLKIARSYDVTIVNFSWDGNYPKKRQWVLDNCKFKTRWIMFIDADERCTPELVSEIQEFLALREETFAAGSVRLNYYFLGKLLRFGHQNWKTVLLDPLKTHFEPIDDLEAPGMGELEGHYQPKIHGKTFKFKNGLVHYDNDPFHSWAERHIRYARWEGYLLNRPDVRSSVYRRKSRPNRGLRLLKFQGLFFFIYAYFFKLGFLDGRAGFDYAFGRAWYYWLSNVIARDEKRA